MNLVYSDKFLRSAKLLPLPQQKKLATLILYVTVNPFDSRLHTKRLAADLAGLHSFRITRDWRVIFKFNDPATIQLLRVGHRRDIYL